MKKYEITQDELQKLANYLYTKPYGEVLSIINDLSNLQEIKKQDDSNTI